MTPPDRPVSARLEELREKLAAGTPGPWRFPVGGAIVSLPGRDNVTFGEVKPPDAALIVAAVNALPALLDIAEAAEKAMHCSEPDGLCAKDRQRLRAALDRLNTEDGAGR